MKFKKLSYKSMQAVEKWLRKRISEGKDRVQNQDQLTEIYNKETESNISVSNIRHVMREAEISTELLTTGGNTTQASLEQRIEMLENKLAEVCNILEFEFTDKSSGQSQ